MTEGRSLLEEAMEELGEFRESRKPEKKAKCEPEQGERIEHLEKKLHENLRKIEEQRKEIEKMHSKKENAPPRVDVAEDLSQILEDNLKQNKKVEGRIKEIMDIVKSIETPEKDLVEKFDSRINKLSKIITELSSDSLRDELTVMKVAVDQLNQRVIELTSELRKMKEDQRVFELLKNVSEKVEEFEATIANLSEMGDMVILKEELDNIRKLLQDITNYYHFRIPDDWGDLKSDIELALQKLAEMDLKLEKMETNQEFMKKEEDEIEAELRELARKT